MDAPTATDTVSVSMWEAEIDGLAIGAHGLVPAARLALSGVLESVLAEQTLTAGEARSAKALLGALRPSAVGHIT